MNFWHSTSGEFLLSAEIPKGTVRGINRGAAQSRIEVTAGNGPVDERGYVTREMYQDNRSVWILAGGHNEGIRADRPGQGAA